MSRLRNFKGWHEATLGLLLAGLLAWAGRVEPAFLSARSQAELATHSWEMALVAVPMTLLIVMGGIDLSVGSTLALAAVVLGLTYEAGVSAWAGAVLAVLTGCACGALNGLFITRLRVHPLIVTLATLAAFRGVAEGISLGRPISGFPDSFAVIGRGTFLGIQVPALFVAAAATAAALLLARMPTGRFIYAIGHNETATRFSGIAVDRIKMWLYTLAGAAAGLAAVLLVARRNTAKADLAGGLELDVITAVVLGGVSIYGGRGNMAGVLLGLVLIHETREFVSWHWNRAELNLVVIGVMLIVAVMLNRVLARGGRTKD